MKASHAYALVGVGFIIIATAFFIPQSARAPKHSVATSTITATSTATTSDRMRYQNATADDITVELPFAGAVVGKSFSVIGSARGYWYFEASFPMRVLAADQSVLWQGPVQANGEWMTTEFVPFKADVVIPPAYIGPATIEITNDNPSGLPENEKSLLIPITIEY